MQRHRLNVFWYQFICVLCEQVYEMDKGILTKQEKLAERDNIWDNNKKAEENK